MGSFKLLITIASMYLVMAAIGFDLSNDGFSFSQILHTSSYVFLAITYCIMALKNR